MEFAAPNNCLNGAFLISAPGGGVLDVNYAWRFVCYILTLNPLHSAQFTLVHSCGPSIITCCRCRDP
eukprot:9233693-Pyramimonas_sp.AAC.1